MVQWAGGIDRWSHQRKKWNNWQNKTNSITNSYKHKQKQPPVNLLYFTTSETKDPYLASLKISLPGTDTVYAYGKMKRRWNKIDPTNVKSSLEDCRTHHENSTAVAVNLEDITFSICGKASPALYTTWRICIDALKQIRIMHVNYVNSATH